MNNERLDRPSKNPLTHVKVVMIAVVFGLGAYACLHVLVWLINILKGAA